MKEMPSNTFTVILMGIVLGATLFGFQACRSDQISSSIVPANDINPKWNPDGTKIVYCSNRDGNQEIYVMDADGSNQTRLTNHPAYDWGPIWSPDGSRLAFNSERDGNSDIYVMDADGSNQTRLTNHPAYDWGPIWSPDGSRLSFTSERDENWEIYVMDADGSIQTRLTNHPAFDLWPIWSPDGSRLAFTSERDGNREIYVMDADGSIQTRLTNHPAFDLWPIWSPDGSRLAFTSERDGNSDIYVMDADGSNQTRLTENSAADGRASWSPDGSRIAFTSERDENWEIYVMDADGSNQIRLTSHPATDEKPTWSPDGTKIAFVSSRELMGFLNDIYVMEADSSNPLNLTNNDKMAAEEIRDIRYGQHERNVLDLWLAESDDPTPLVIFYHGGGFRYGDKRGSMLPTLLLKLLDAGISVAGVNYRLSDTAPFPAQMLDSARALQFIRYHAQQYNIDPNRIGATGGSAGAGISLWLAFHDDLADPDNEDPILRLSTRLTAVVPYNGQSSYDPRFIQEQFNTDKVHPAFIAFFGMNGPEDIHNPDFHPLFEEASPLSHVTTDDPPVYLYFGQSNQPLPPNSTGGQHIHHPKFGIVLKEKLDSFGVECILKFREDYPDGHPYDKYVSFFREKFGWIE